MKYVLYIAIILSIFSCKESAPLDPMEKIKFDINAIDNHGLEVGSEQKSSIYYQFCIPDSDSIAMEVFKTEPAIDIYVNQAGEIGCGEGQRLAMGHTHPNGWKKRIQMLAELPYVTRIERVSYGSQ